MMLDVSGQGPLTLFADINHGGFADPIISCDCCTDVCGPYASANDARTYYSSCFFRRTSPKLFPISLSSARVIIRCPSCFIFGTPSFFFTGARTVISAPIIQSGTIFSAGAEFAAAAIKQCRSVLYP